VGGLLHLAQRGGAWAGCGPTNSLLSVPNVTAHPSTASVPIAALPYDGLLLCGFNMAIKELICQKQDQVITIIIATWLQVCRGRGWTGGKLRWTRASNVGKNVSGISEEIFITSCIFLPHDRFLNNTRNLTSEKCSACNSANTSSVEKFIVNLTLHFSIQWQSPYCHCTHCKQCIVLNAGSIQGLTVVQCCRPIAAKGCICSMTVKSCHHHGSRSERINEIMTCRYKMALIFTRDQSRP